MITYVTALFDIDRENKGDGRSIEMYLDWMRETCKMNVCMVIFTQPNLLQRIRKLRAGQEQKTIIYPQTLAEIPYAHYRQRTIEIIHSSDYQSKIKAPERVECKLPDYSLVIHSKFEWLKRVAEENPFKTPCFAWCDAGLSRFFPDHFDLHRPLDTQKVFDLVHGDRCLIQTRPDIHRLKTFKNLGYDTINFLTATLFFGGEKVIQQLATSVRQVFLHKLLARNIVNNEQISLAFVARKSPAWFSALPNHTGEHLSLLRALQPDSGDISKI